MENRSSLRLGFAKKAGLAIAGMAYEFDFGSF
jgi:hypothetical protein